MSVPKCLFFSRIWTKNQFWKFFRPKFLVFSWTSAWDVCSEMLVFPGFGGPDRRCPQGCPQGKLPLWAEFSFLKPRTCTVRIFTVGVECGENWGRTGGELGAPKRTGGEPGHLGREPGENRGLLVFIYKEYRGRRGGFGTRTGGEPGGGEFYLKQETQLGT